jgi:hypothetical protein
MHAALDKARKFHFCNGDRRFNAYILRIAFWVAVLGGLALVLTLSGLFSVLSYIVEQRAMPPRSLFWTTSRTTIGIECAAASTDRTPHGPRGSESVRAAGTLGVMRGIVDSVEHG